MEITPIETRLKRVSVQFKKKKKKKKKGSLEVRALLELGLKHLCTC